MTACFADLPISPPPPRTITYTPRTEGTSSLREIGRVVQTGQTARKGELGVNPVPIRAQKKQTHPCNAAATGCIQVDRKGMVYSREGSAYEKAPESSGHAIALALADRVRPFSTQHPPGRDPGRRAAEGWDPRNPGAPLRAVGRSHLPSRRRSRHRSGPERRCQGLPARALPDPAYDPLAIDDDVGGDRDGIEAVVVNAPAAYNLMRSRKALRTRRRTSSGISSSESSPVSLITSL